MERRPKRHENSPCPFPIVPVQEAVKFDIPETEEGWAALAKLKKVDANDLMNELGRSGFRRWLDESPTLCITWNKESRIVRSQNYLDCYQEMREPVIEHLLRRSETMNIIAPPKSSKSWLGLNIAMNVIGGGRLFDKFQCTRGRVLIIDNELHAQTVAQRLRDVAHALNVPLHRAGQLIDYMSLRGQLTSLEDLAADLLPVRRGEYNVVILDAFYKFYPKDFDENSNSEMARLYTILDGFAEHLDAGVILIHHSSKGLQSGKGVTDMGAGAGSQSRACDAHLVLRENEDPGVFSIDCANRSFKAIAPFCAKFKWPRWENAPGSLPDNLKGLKKQPGAARTGGGKPGEQSAPTDWRSDEKRRINEFVDEIVTPKTIPEILSMGNSRSFRPWNRDRMKKLIPELITEGKLKEVTKANGPHGATYMSSAVKEHFAPPDDEENKNSHDGYTAGYSSESDESDYSSHESDEECPV